MGEAELRDLFGRETKTESVRRDKWTWMICREVLKQYGINKERAGNLIGRWISACGGDHLKLRAIVEEAAEHERGDIVSFINGCMPKNGGAVDEEAFADLQARRARLRDAGLNTLR